MLDILQENINITHLSNYKTPATTRWYFELNTLQDIEFLSQIFDFVDKYNIPVLCISWGTNMLFAFEKYEWLVIKNNLSWWSYDRDTYILNTASNEAIWQIAETLECDFWQDLWHRFIGLPGSIWWAIYWNAGCFGLEVQHHFLDCQVYHIPSRKTQTLTNSEASFNYRTSHFKQHSGEYIILSARFNLSEKREKYHSDVDNIYFREHQQPKWNSCGSFFKNPSREQSAWSLIEQVGLKWHYYWGAYFSEKHANFLMHDGQGTYQDMLALIDLALQKVKDAYNIELENEVRIITNP